MPETHRRAMLIPADPDSPICLFSYSNGLDDWQKIVKNSDEVHSGLFDVVATPDFDAWVDDEGLYVAEPKRNRRLEKLLSEYGELIQPLVGDVIITGGPDSEGGTTDLKPEVVAKVLAVTA